VVYFFLVTISDLTGFVFVCVFFFIFFLFFLFLSSDLSPFCKTDQNLSFLVFAVAGRLCFHMTGTVPSLCPSQIVLLSSLFFLFYRGMRTFF